MENDERRHVPAKEDARAPAGVLVGGSEKLGQAAGLAEGLISWLIEQVPSLDDEVRYRGLFVQQLMACRGGSSSTSDNARKALAHWRLKYNELKPDRLGVEAVLAEKVEAIRPTLVKLLDQLLRVELLTIDRNHAIEAEKRYADKRSEEDRTSLFTSARGVVDRLYEDFGIAEGHWFTVSEEGLAILAEVLRRESDRAGLGSPMAPALRNKKRAKRSR